MTSNEILEAITKYKAENPKQARFFGIRRDSAQYTAGDEMHYSHRWYDGIETDEELDGTCSIVIGDDGFFLSDWNSDEENIAQIDAALKAVELYSGKHTYIIAGAHFDYGEDNHEIVIYNDFSAAICVAEI